MREKVMFAAFPETTCSFSSGISSKMGNTNQEIMAVKATVEAAPPFLDEIHEQSPFHIPCGAMTL
jgi:hypothetical protein